MRMGREGKGKAPPPPQVKRLLAPRAPPLDLIAIRQSELVLQSRKQMQQIAFVLHGMRHAGELRLGGALKGGDSQRLEFVAAGKMTRRHLSSAPATGSAGSGQATDDGAPEQIASTMSGLPV